MPETVAQRDHALEERRSGGYHLRFETVKRRVRVFFNEVAIADSSRALLMHETRHPPVYYFPAGDVRIDCLERSALNTYCPFKGNASYWGVVVGDRSVKDAAWSYEDPYPEAFPVRGWIAFYMDRLDELRDEDASIDSRARESWSVAGNPLAEWLLRDASEAQSSTELVGGLCRELLAAGTPIWRLRLAIRTLHPQLLSTSYLWERGGQVEEEAIGHQILHDQRFLDSPLVPIYDGAGGVRRRLEGPSANLDYPIVRELQEAGATDYVAMPVTFSDGQINFLSMASDVPGGFTVRDLGQVYEILPTFSRLLEVHAVRRNAANLLDTYLGPHSGRKVLEGQVRRGEGEDIYAVLWFSDLRDSTSLADSMGRADYLGLLNTFFECTAGAVQAHGGEVLRFIGDAALAIFPIDGAPAARDHECRESNAACHRALAASRSAGRRLATLNLARSAEGLREIAGGIALHAGDVTYGNIGTEDRLEFTVVGAAANEAARIESLCKTLRKSVLVSEDFVRLSGIELVSLGRHSLRGVGAEKELFTLPELA